MTNLATGKKPSDWDELTGERPDIYLRGSASPEEQQKIEEMKKKIGADVLESEPLKNQEENIADDKFLRFLRGYESDVDKAVPAYVAMLEFFKLHMGGVLG